MFPQGKTWPAILFLAPVAIVVVSWLVARQLSMTSIPGPTTESTRVVSLAVLAHGQNSGVAERRHLVIANEADWRLLWREINTNLIPTPSLPVVDFGQNMVIAVFMGRRSTGGYSTEIIEVLETKKKLIVKVEEKSPPPGAIVTQVITQPYYIVTVPGSGKEVVFETQTGVRRGR